MDSGHSHQADKDLVDHSTDIPLKVDDKSFKSANVSSLAQHPDNSRDTKKSDSKSKNELTTGSSVSPKIANKPADLKLTPVFHRKVSPLLVRHKHKRTKSFDKFSMGLKKSPSGFDFSDSEHSDTALNDDRINNRCSADIKNVVNSSVSAGPVTIDINTRSNEQDTCQKPHKWTGYLLKNRRAPVKGWHKRFFSLEDGVLTYAKTQVDMERGRLHGNVDLGHSVITDNLKHCRIDLDTGDLICHIKAKALEQFNSLMQHLHEHQLYRKHQFESGLPQLESLSSAETFVSAHVSPRPSGGGYGLDGALSRPSWQMDSQTAEAWNTELSMAKTKLAELGQTLKVLQQASVRDSSLELFQSKTLECPSPAILMTPAVKLEKPPSRRHFVVRHNKKDKNKELAVVTNSLISDNCVSATNLDSVSNDGASVTEDLAINHEQMKAAFCVMATDVFKMLECVCESVTEQKERLQEAVEQQSQTMNFGPNVVIHTLKQSLAEAVEQNEKLRSRLQRIHNESELSVGAGGGATALSPLQLSTQISSVIDSFNGLHLRSSFMSSMSAESPSEFYDAAEHLDSSTDYSEEVEDEDLSDVEHAVAVAVDQTQLSRFQTRRRSKLPATSPESDVGLWSLLRKNIGKDLSKISMPVSLNEPLNALQRLCEELEYSDLLDHVSDINDPCERMVLVTAFVISCYGSTSTRCAYKPFNPLLGETYECVREDRGWSFIAEQVSHHPPISACFCQSPNFVCWQDMQIKTKFWGKSMEVQPLGMVHLKLPRLDGEEYSWNKATSCIHNILGGQRWVEHHGEVTVTNHSMNIHCKLTFMKSSYWSDKRDEVQGTVYNANGKAVHQLFGRWSEGIYSGDAESAKCIWRPGVLHPEAELYYGFTRFAIELNEIQAEHEHLYPRTDTRFRRDQRLLEEGKLMEAENQKQLLEQMQRGRLKQFADRKAIYAPQWFTKVMDGSQEKYIYNGKYWDMRRDPGFASLPLPTLW